MKNLLPCLLAFVLVSCRSSSTLYQIEREPDVPFASIQTGKIFFEGLNPQYVVPALHSADSANTLYAIELSSQFKENLPQATLITPLNRSSKKNECDYVWKITNIEGGGNALTRDQWFSYDPVSHRTQLQAELEKASITVYIDFIELRSNRTLFKLKSTGEYVKESRYDYWKRALWTSISPVVRYISNNGRGY